MTDSLALIILLGTAVMLVVINAARYHDERVSRPRLWGGRYWTLDQAARENAKQRYKDLVAVLRPYSEAQREITQKESERK